MAMIKHFKVLKISSLQCLYNISKKEVRNGVCFLHADKHQSFYKLAVYFFMEVARHVQSTQYIKKKVSKQLMCFIVMQNIPILFFVTRFTFGD